MLWSESTALVKTSCRMTSRLTIRRPMLSLGRDRRHGNSVREWIWWKMSAWTWAPTTLTTKRRRECQAQGRPGMWRRPISNFGRDGFMDVLQQPHGSGICDEEELDFQ